jgi:tellurite resistance protein TerC
MTADQLSYLIFGIAVIISIVIDLGLFSKKNQVASIKSATYQSIFWVIISLAYFGVLWYEEGRDISIQYLSAYLMEKSLSIDNIFVFVIIFSSFRIKEQYIGRALFYGVLMAIVFRVIFITIGVALIARFEWILYIFGAFLLYTGFKMFFSSSEDEFKPQASRLYRIMRSYLRYTDEEPEGRYIIWKKNKAYFTRLSLVIIFLGFTDIVFALDSIPAVFAISSHKLVIYTSNIFAVLGLRALFFMLRGAASKFDYLQQGVSVVLVFIGIKMLIAYFDIHIPTLLSFGFIIFSITASILYSIYHNHKQSKLEEMEDQIEE